MGEFTYCDDCGKRLKLDSEFLHQLFEMSLCDECYNIRINIVDNIIKKKKKFNSKTICRTEGGNPSS